MSLQMSDSAIPIAEVSAASDSVECEGEAQGAIQTLSICRDWASIKAIEKQWIDWQIHPNADPEFVRFIIAVRPECEQPYAIAAQSGQVVKALLVGRMEHPLVPIKIGYLQITRLELRVITFLHGGVLGSFNTQNSEEVVNAVLDRISKGDADAAYFDHVRQDTPLAEALRKIPSRFRCDAVVKTQPHYSMRIPESTEGFYASLSPKVRKNQRWQAKKLIEAFSGQVEVRSYNHEQDLNTVFSDVDQIAGTTYQRGLGVGFLNTPETRGRMELSVRNGWLQAFVLYLAGKPSAFWIGTRYRNRFFSDFMGYDAANAKYSPGMYLVMKGIEHFCEEESTARILEVDFGLGDAQYKQVLATDSWTDQSTYLYSMNVRGMSLKVSRSITGIVDKCARTALRRLHLENSLKNLWRRRAAGR